MAADLRKEPGVTVELVDGSRGEFTVLVDGRVVAQKGQTPEPSAENVRKALRETMPAGV